LICVTASPTLSMTPMISCPMERPTSNGVRPSYMCRSEPQMAADVIFSRASVFSSMRGISMSSTATFLTPL